MNRMNASLMAAILAGPGFSSRRAPDDWDMEKALEELGDITSRPADRTPAGQCRGCRTRISVNKDYCLKCKTADEVSR